MLPQGDFEAFIMDHLQRLHSDSMTLSAFFAAARHSNNARYRTAVSLR